MIRIGIHGAAGRMGRRLAALASEDAGLRVAAAADAPGHPLLGQDAGVVAGVAALGCPLVAELPVAGLDVVIDFSLPAALPRVLGHCVRHRQPLVVGTTGLLAGDHAAIDEAARVIPVLQSPNMSLGVNLLFALAAQVARRLGDDYDIEVVEAHHRYKKDAPSGTALGIVKAICDATGKSPERDVVYGRHGEAERRRGEIGVHAVRVGDVVGDHTVTFGAPGERIELTHLASTRDVFARGALRAAAWLHGKPVGRFSMSDVLGL